MPLRLKDIRNLSFTSNRWSKTLEWVMSNISSSIIQKQAAGLLSLLTDPRALILSALVPWSFHEKPGCLWIQIFWDYGMLALQLSLEIIALTEYLMLD